MTKEKLRRWELALLLGVAVACLVGVWLSGQQQGLADKVIRLHVVANSDEVTDQTLKLQVRDAILAKGLPALGDGGREDAMTRLSMALPQIAQVGAQVVEVAGYRYPVRVSLEETWFPTKHYNDLSLPAGTYTALRVELGAGDGQNWWCVVFPPLCLGSVSESTTEASGLTDGDLALMAGESGGYVVKFKAIELWEEFRHNMGWVS